MLTSTIAPRTDDDRGLRHRCVSSPSLVLVFFPLSLKTTIHAHQHQTNTRTNVNGARDASMSRAPGIFSFFLLALLTIIITRLHVQKPR